MWVNTKYHWWLVCINHLVTDSFSGCGSFQIHQKAKESFLLRDTNLESLKFFSERWGDSNLCNEKFSTQHRGWTFSPPLPGSALEPSRRNSQRRKSAASWSCGWCGATCALHSHKHKLLALRERTWHNNKHARASFWLKWALFVLLGFATVQSKNALTLLCKYFFWFPLCCKYRNTHTHARTR